MVQDGDFVAIFHSIHKVMKAEKVLKGVGADVLLIPVPRQLTSDCGLAIRYGEEQAGLVLETLGASELRATEIYQRRGKDFCRLG